MQTADNFYVFLPSNSSASHFIDNTHANYRVWLPKPIDLMGDYEVALVESFFLSNWFNVVDESEGSLHIKNTTKNEVRKINIRRGYYAKPEYLIQEINNAITRTYGEYALETDPVISEDISIEDFIKRIQQAIHSAEELEKKSAEIETQKENITEWENRVANFYATFTQAGIMQRIAQGEIDLRADSHEMTIKNLQAELTVLIENPESVFPGDITAPLKRRADIQKLIQDANVKNMSLIPDEEEKLNKLKAETLAAEREYHSRKASLDQRKITFDLKQQELLALHIKHDAHIQAQEGAKDVFRSYTIKKTERLFPYFIYDSNSRKTRIYLPSSFAIKLPEALQRMLGFIPSEEYFENLSKEAIYEQSQLLTELTSDLSSIYIYCNIINTQYVGDTLVPLLRVLHLSDTDGVRVTKTFQNPFYMSVTHQHIDTIEIDIRDSYGRAIHFPSGAVVLNVLHFRRANNTP